MSLPHALTVDLRRAQYREALMVTSTFAAVDAQVSVFFWCGVCFVEFLYETFSFKVAISCRHMCCKIS